MGPSNLSQGDDGSFYGIINKGGGQNTAIFKVSPDGTFSILHEFTGDAGFGPSSLIQASDGNFYGTTRGNLPTVFKMLPNGTVSTIAVYSPGFPVRWYGSLVQGTDGYLYGGGDNGIFRVSLAGELAFVTSVLGTSVNDLTVGTDGALYGTTVFGGSSNLGTVFRVSGGTHQLVHTFGSGSEGIYPGRLIQAADGDFYGTTSAGGLFQLGTIFRMTPAGVVTTLHSFDDPRVSHPFHGVIQASNGDFYGRTLIGDGAIFRLTAGGVFSVAHLFLGNDPYVGRLDGSGPGSLIAGDDGHLYGTTASGNIGNYGSVFRLGLDGQFTLLRSFSRTLKGARPSMPPLQSSNGLFYGSTAQGGTHNKGVVYEMNGSGDTTILHEFADGSTDGAYPQGSLLEATSGLLVGTTSHGGASGCGTVFRVTKTGVFNVLHHFTCGGGGAHPAAGLIQADDGLFYGSTKAGGASGLGTAFRVAASGAFELLHSFAGAAADGATPEAAFVQAFDSYLYGTTSTGGTSNAGTIFRMSPAGDVMVLHSFPSRRIDPRFAPPPMTGLVAAVDGTLYGTVTGRPAAFFNITTDGLFRIIHTFRGPFFCSYCTEPDPDPPPYEQPQVQVIQANDGHFYGFSLRPNPGSFIFFQLTDGGLFTELLPIQQAAPVGQLMQARDLRLYGVTTNGPAAAGVGSVFRLRLPFLEPAVALIAEVNGSPSALSDVAAGDSMIWTAFGTGGRAPLQYRFWIRSDTIGWRIVQDYSSINTLQWSPSASGNYIVQVWAKSADATSAWDAWASSDQFSVSPPRPVALSALTPTPRPPLQTGESSVWYAAASGGIGPLQYKFWLLEPGTGWRVIQDWSSVNHVRWTPLISGSYNLQVWARSAGTNGAWEAWRGTGELVVANGPLTLTEIVADKAFPIGPGTQLTWSAIVAGDHSVAVEYRFWLYNVETQTWTMVRDYHTANSWTWTPTAGDVGTYALQVWARRQGSDAGFETWIASDAPFQVASGPLSVTLASDQGEPPHVPPGTRMTWRASVTAATGPVEYQFWRYDGRTQSWSAVQAYGPSEIYEWTPTATDAGYSVLQVWARNVGSSQSFQAWTSSGPFTIQP